MEKTTQSVITALRVIERVSLDQPVGVSDLARSLDMPKSSTHRVLSTLSSAGWLRQDNTGRWALALRCAAIGRRVGDESSLRAVARPVMADVSAATRENLRLWLIEGETLAIIETVEGDHAVRPVELPPGAAVPLHATAVGKAVLASWSDHALENFLARPLPAFTPATITDPAALRRQIHQAQARGYAEVSDEAQIDIGGVAAVFRLPDERLGALALTFPRHRLDRDTVVTFGGLVAAAARKIEDSVNGTRAA